LAIERFGKMKSKYARLEDLEGDQRDIEGDTPKEFSYEEPMTQQDLREALITLPKRFLQR